MGQKINPTGFRLAISRNWSSRWYANNRDFAGMLAEDKNVVLRMAAQKLSMFDQGRLTHAVVEYGSVATQKQFRLWLNV